jgi:hypothetical protein
VMRYAVVIEKAGANYRLMCQTCRAASQLAKPGKKQSGKSARPCGFILRDLGSMVCRHPNRRRLWLMSKPNELSRVRHG